MKSSIVLLAALVLLACSRGNPPSSGDSAGQPTLTLSTMREHPATLVHYGDGPTIEVPAFARSGEKFTITVTTFGGGCTREDRTEVRTKGLTAEVRPIQKFPANTRNLACTADLLIHARPVTLSFATAGTAEIHVYGRVEPGDSAVTIVRTVAIR